MANDPTYASIVKDLQSVLLFNFRGPGKSIAGCPSKKLSDFDGLSDERKRHIFEMYG